MKTSSRSGADSLTVAQLLSRLRARFGVDFSFRDIFDAPTVATLAARIESSKKGTPSRLLACAISPADSRGRLSMPTTKNLCPEQDRSRSDTSTTSWTERFCPGRSILTSLEASIATISERHEALRSIFFERLGEPMQTVTTVRPWLERLDLRPLPSASEPPRFNRRHWSCCDNRSILKGSRRYGCSY